MEKYKLWAKVSCSIRVSRADAKRISEDPDSYMMNAIKNGQFRIEEGAHLSPIFDEEELEIKQQ